MSETPAAPENFLFANNHVFTFHGEKKLKIGRLILIKLKRKNWDEIYNYILILTKRNINLTN